jgi:trehalose 6-phosphate phosphatase
VPQGRVPGGRGLVPEPLVAMVDGAADAVLFVDFDGSLAPIVDDPAAARVLPAARAAVARLVPLLGTVAVVSGRPAAFLVDALGIDRVVYAGTYGLERVIDGAVVVDARVTPWLDAVTRAADDAETALPGLLVERKGRVAVTVHWRTQPDRGPEAMAWAEAAAGRLGLEAPLRGRMAVELRPPVPVDKGTTVVDLAQGATTAAFAGDDAGDLPAFDALHALVAAGALRHAISIGVASDEGPPEVRDADVVVDGPGGLARLLDALADEISARA